jgi:hypothetical protein
LKVGITRSGTTATVSHPNHGFASLYQVEISGADQTEYNGLKAVTVLDNDSYTYFVSGSPTTPATGDIRARYIRPTWTLDESNIVDNGIRIFDTARAIWKMVTPHQKVYTPNTQFDAGATSGNRGVMNREYRRVHSTQDSTIKTAHPEARIVQQEYFAQAGVDLERDRLIELFGTERNVFEIDCWAKPLEFEIGSVGTVTHPYFELPAGKDFVFIGAGNQLDSGLVTGYFWG